MNTDRRTRRSAKKSLADSARLRKGIAVRRRRSGLGRGEDLRESLRLGCRQWRRVQPANSVWTASEGRKQRTTVMASTSAIGRGGGRRMANNADTVRQTRWHRVVRRPAPARTRRKGREWRCWAVGTR